MVRGRRECVYDGRDEVNVHMIGGRKIKCAGWEGGQEGVYDVHIAHPSLPRSSFVTSLLEVLPKKITRTIFFYRKTIGLSDRRLNDEHENICYK